jgi:hypothetical protein
VIIASNGISPEATQAFTLNVDQAPSFTSSSSTNFSVDESASFAVATTGYPTPTFSESGALPSGVFFSSTGVLSGTPAPGTGGAYPILITATNGDSAGATQAFTLNVDQAPVFTSSSSTTFTLGSPASFSVAARGYPAPTFTESGTLPSGVSFSSSGVLSGTPAPGTAGTFPIVITAANGIAPDDTQSFTLTIAQHASLANSLITVVPSVQAGGTGTINLQAVDAYGNDLTVGGLQVAFYLVNATGGQAKINPAIDNGNGTYSATFTGTIAGTNTITATINGTPITFTGPTITITPGQASPTTSVLTLSAPTIQLGGVATVTLQARDAYGNDLTSGGLSAAASLSFATGAKGTLSTFTDNHNGTYTATFTSTSDGSNDIAAIIGGDTIASVAPITVTGTPVSLGKSSVKIATATIAASGLTTVTFQAENASGSRETAGGLPVVFSLASKSGAQGGFSAVTDNGNGTYTAEFSGTLAGSNAIVASVAGVKGSTAAATVKVVAGQFSPEKSLVSVSARSVKAGSAVTLTLQPEDAFGNKLTNAGLAVAFEVNGTMLIGHYQSNGTYTAKFTGTTVGVYTVATSLNGESVTSTPPTITVTPGSASVAKSILVTPATSVVAGSAITVTLQTLDAYGNAETSGGSKVAFQLSNSKGASGVFSPAIDHGNGSYTTTFIGTLAGTNAFEATINGVKVTSHLPVITVYAGAASVAKSVVTLSAPTEKVGGSVTVTLQARDAYGNNTAADQLIVAFALASTTGGQGTFSSVTNNYNGTYSATLTATTPGTNVIEAMIAGEKVTSTAAIKVI